MKRIILLLALCCMMAPRTEVERYSIGMEVTRADEASRVLSLCGDDISASVNASEATFARYRAGDWVEVEITTYENALTHRHSQEFAIIGDLIED